MRVRPDDRGRPPRAARERGRAARARRSPCRVRAALARRPARDGPAGGRRDRPLVVTRLQGASATAAADALARPACPKGPGSADGVGLEGRAAEAAVDREGPDRILRDQELVLHAHLPGDDAAGLALQPEIVVLRDLVVVEGDGVLEAEVAVRLELEVALER